MLGHSELGAGQLCAGSRCSTGCRYSAGSRYTNHLGNADGCFPRRHVCCCHSYPSPRNAGFAHRNTPASPYPDGAAVAHASPYPNGAAVSHARNMGN